MVVYEIMLMSIYYNIFTKIW